MSLLAGPLVYLSDGAPASLAAFPQVASFASTIGSRAVLARVQRRVDPEAKPDQHFLAALNGLAVDGVAPVVIPVERRHLGKGLLAHSELRDGALALAPRRRAGLGRMLFGTSYERLLRDTRMPLLTLPADGIIGSIRRILFPADLSPRSLAAFDQTLVLCRELNAALDVLHVYGEDRLLPSEMDMERRNAAQSPGELFKIHKEGITALVERAKAAGVRVESKSAEGRAHTHILTYASKNPIDLIVMPTHGPRSTEDIMRGSTTVRVINQSPVPMLVYKA